MDGIAGVQARIDEILGRFGTAPIAAPATSSASGMDFASALTDAEAAAATGDAVDDDTD